MGRRVVRHGRLRNDDPAGLHVNVSASCNLGCKMCPYLGVHDNPGYVSEMSEETFRTLLPAIARLPSLHISGAGEPFFNRDVVRFIQLAREANPTIDVDITTNGTLITETMARALIGVHLTRLVISLDGATERTVGAIRLGINFRKVLDHIRTLTRLKQELGSPWPKVRVNYMVGYGSYAELPEFMRLAWEIGVEEVHLLDIFDGTAEAFEHNLVNSMARDQARALRDAKKLADGRGIRLTLPYTQHNACLHPYTPHVSEQGLVSPCCYVDYDGRTFWQGASSVRLPTIDYGNINSDAFGEIWTSPAYTELRARNKRGDFPDFCRTCHSARVATSRAVHDAMD
ncbi:MAG: radical SAM protein [Vicinamibacterales bacterium]